MNHNKRWLRRQISLHALRLNIKEGEALIYSDDMIEKLPENLMAWREQCHKTIDNLKNYEAHVLAKSIDSVLKKGLTEIQNTLSEPSEIVKKYNSECRMLNLLAFGSGLAGVLLFVVGLDGVAKRRRKDPKDNSPKP
jgi:hypothetical protein